MNFKRLIRRNVRRFGFDVIRLPPEQVGVDPFVDMRRLLQGCSTPTIIDVGANIGQSVTAFKDTFPDPVIHSFEPSPTTFGQLRANCRHRKNVNLWNAGVGATDETRPFLENENSVMSSFLPPSEFAWGTITKTTEVDMVSLDAFCAQNAIEFVHVLKSDTQGFDFEVFKGAQRMMDANRIALIYFEFIFSDMYKGLPSFYEVFRYLSERNFALVTFYRPHFQRGLVSWTDALLVNRDFNERRFAVADSAHD